MKPNLPQTKRHQRAQAMVEFALVFPLLILLMYSLLEFGRLLFIYISVINSSREAARYGSSVGNPSAYRYVDCDGMIDAARRSAILATIQPEDIIITYDTGDSPPTTLFGGAQCGDASIDPAEIKSPNRVHVQVTLTYSPIMPVQWASFPITARSARTIIKGIEVAGDNVGDLGTPSVQFTSAGGGTFNEGTDHTVELVMLGGTSTVDVTVGLGIEAVTADGSDISMPMSVTFLANQQYASIDVTMLSEPCDEEEIETLRLKILSVPAGVIKGYPVVYTINIQDMDPTPTLDFELTNSNRAEDGGAAAVNVYLSQPSCREVIFTYTAEDITTTENVDYTLQTMPITIPALDNGAVTTVTLVDDELYENDEEVRLTLTSAQYADLGTQIEHVLTIVDDDPMPVVSFDVATSIGSEDIPRVFIYARMDRFSAIETQVRLNIDPAGTTAQNGNGGNPGDDFDIDEGVLTIPAGEREAEIEITIFNNDADTEENETVALALSDPVNAELGTPSTHTLTIRENAQAAEVGFQNAGVSRDENFGVAIARLVLSEATNANVTISFGVGGTASAGFDYSGITLSPVTIKAGALSVDILVPIIDDTYDEANETIILNITSASGAAISDDLPTSHTILILDNDNPPVVNFTGSSSTLEEGSSLSITAVLSKPSNLQITVDLSLGGSAPASDYTILSATPLTFIPGSVSQTIQLTLTDDDLFTGSRSLEIGLVSPVNVEVGSPSLYTITILDNEVCPTLTGWTLDGKNAYTTVSLPVDAPIIQLTGLTLTQQTGQQLKQIELGTNNTIFQGNASGSPLTITTFKNGADLFISGPAGGRIILLSFQDTITLSGSYSLSLTWSNGCVVGKP